MNAPIARTLVLGASFTLCLLAASCSSSEGSPAPAATDAGDGGTSPSHEDDASTTGDGSATDLDASDGADADCTTAVDTALASVDKVSEGEVLTLSDEGGTRTLFIDATAGGPPGAATNPRVYVNLETGTRVDLTDVAARTDTTWDLAFKRAVILTNGGQVGTGAGASAFVSKSFADTAQSDAASATFQAEEVVDATCAPKVDPMGNMQASMGWYDYNEETHRLSPRAETWLVKGATGKLYKVQVLDYYAAPDGGVGEAGGRYKIAVGAL